MNHHEETRMNANHTVTNVEREPLDQQSDGFVELAGLELAWVGGGSGDVVW